MAMNCTNCGTALAAETSFCANCGTPRGVAPQAAPQATPAAPNYAQPAPAGQTNGLAIASLVLSILGCTALVGAILGHVALGQIKRTGQGGRGLAVAGVAIGWGFLGFQIIYGVIIVMASTSGYYGY